MSSTNRIEIPSGIYLLGAAAARTTGIWAGLSRLEAAYYQEQLDKKTIDRPVFICGLARSGTTILLELLSAHQAFAGHRYKDFPFLFTPIWWNKFLSLAASGSAEPAERAHKDRILITPDSPEALEEPLWMHFFSSLQDESTPCILGRSTANPKFETFFRTHIKKILHLRNGERYLSKGNYNLARLGYLSKLFPDARFVLPVREPVSHVASLRKQHRLFCREEERDPRILTHMQRLGHFEFGLGRCVMNLQDGCAESIRELWDNGEEVRGLARCWSSAYSHAADLLENDAQIKSASLVIHYDDLCTSSKNALSRMYQHVEIKVEEEVLREQAGRLSYPSYYQSAFSDAELDAIHEETHHAHERIKKLSCINT